jgi:hypothetical protein
MTVAELRRLLNGVANDLEIVVRGFDWDGDDYCGTIHGVEVQCRHHEGATPFLALDCGPEEEDPADG